MKFCIYSPYIPKHFGGGERYLLAVAKVLAKRGEVSIAVSGGRGMTRDHNQRLKRLYEDFLGEKLSENINFVNSPLGVGGDFLEKLLWTKQFDVMYYATDGSLFFSLAKRNILHIQIPFGNKMSGWFDQLKLKNWQIKNTNSKFTKKTIEKNWRTKVDEVHWPVMIARDDFIKEKDLAKKQKVILNVGRFFKQLHSKRQDVLVDIFAKLLEKSGAKDWQLVLIGNVEDQKFFEEIKDQIKKNKLKNIKILTKLSREDLLSWYKRASIYWHATGFGVDEAKHPEKMEHFGISTVEAMSYGCAPIVINKGGQKEIMSGDLREWLWEDQNECVSKTLKLIKSESLRGKIQKLAIKRATEFSEAKFEKTLWRMVGGGK